VTTVYWDITSRCNGKCSYCAAGRMLGETRSPDLSTELVFTTLDDLRAAGVGTVIFLGGEPTLRDDLAQIIGCAAGRGLGVGIATNGLALTAPLRRALVDHIGRLSVNFSLDSTDDAANDLVRGSGHRDICLGAIGDLMLARRDAGSPVRITVQVTLTRAAIPRLRETLLQLIDLGVDSVLVDRMRTFAWQDAAVKALAPGPEEWIGASRLLARTATEEGISHRLLLNYGHAKLKAALEAWYRYPIRPERRCPGGLETAVIDTRGWFHPCRVIGERPVPRREDGRPYFVVRPPRVGTSETAGFLRSPYFVDFFNFAHAAGVYERISACRACPHYLECEPCPLDVVTFGDRVLAECRIVDRMVEQGGGR